jgi:peptide subunit release factor 1 (eRF1)
VVYDGNRRVTCLKLLCEPHKAPTKDWADYFRARRSEWTGKFPDRIQCQIEPDRDRLDEILYRRHTGGQSGVGQSQWDPEAKSNFVRRTGKKTRVNVAEEIENKLREAGLLKAGKRLPRSNLNRLLSAEGFRNRVGISVAKNHVEFTHKESVVLSALARIADDLIAKQLVLENIWSKYRQAGISR